MGKQQRQEPDFSEKVLRRLANKIAIDEVTIAKYEVAIENLQNQVEQLTAENKQLKAEPNNRFIN